MNTPEDKTISGLDGNLPEAGMAEQVSMTEDQLARYAADLLKANSQHLPAATAQRLAEARGLAVSQLAGQQTQAIHHNGHVLQWFGDYLGHHRNMSTVLIIGVILMAFFAAQHFGFNNNLEGSDAFLLASDLPPEAYADKGFDTWLGSK